MIGPTTIGAIRAKSNLHSAAWSTESILAHQAADVRSCPDDVAHSLPHEEGAKRTRSPDVLATLACQ
jgi:hypothetical protein